MSKVHNATCNAGTITVNGKPVPGVVVLSEGLGQSEGVLIQDEKGLWYVPKASPDLVETLEQMITALDKSVKAVTDTLTLMQNVNSSLAGSGSAPYPAFATDKAAIDSTLAEVTTAKTALDTLKGQLI